MGDEGKKLPAESAAAETEAPSAASPWFGRICLGIAALDVLTGDWFGALLMGGLGLAYLYRDRFLMLTGRHPGLSPLQISGDDEAQLLPETPALAERFRLASPIQPGGIRDEIIRPAYRAGCALPLAVIIGTMAGLWILGDAGAPFLALFPLGIALAFVGSIRYRYHRLRGGAFLDRSAELQPLVAGAVWRDSPEGPALVVTLGASSGFGAWGAPLTCHLLFPEAESSGEIEGEGGWRPEEASKLLPNQLGKYYWAAWELSAGHLPAGIEPDEGFEAELRLIAEGEVALRHRIRVPSRPPGTMP